MTTHETYIAQTHELAIAAGKRGDAPFGALLVHGDKILATGENSENTGKSYGHAEYNLVQKSIAQFPDSILVESTLYTSTTPCFRCTCSILAAGIQRIVYSVSPSGFTRLFPEPYTLHSCEETIRLLGAPVELIGPILEDQGMLVYQYWGGKFVPLAEMLERARQGKKPF